MMFCAVLLRYARSCINLNSQTRNKIVYKANLARSFRTSIALLCENADAVDSTEGESAAKKTGIDRKKIIPVETSIKYLKSEAYKTTYGDKPVWEQYRRNHKGMYPPRKTRKTCIRGGVLSTGNPCPICRDEYLVLNEHNVELLKQFISPHTGEVLSYSKTGVCQKRHLDLLVAIERAKDCGLITFDLPFVEYDYSEYYKNINLEQLSKTQYNFNQ